MNNSPNLSPTLTEIDMSKTTSHGGEGIDLESTYLCLIDGRFRLGLFGNNWYGLDLHCGIHSISYRPDEYSWQKLWKIENASDIAKALEHEYAVARKEFSVKHGLTRSRRPLNDEERDLEDDLGFVSVPITGDDPIENFYYNGRWSDE